jgi:hypothetical protein
MRLSVLDGVLYSVMVGFGDVYFLADAVRLGASATVQGLVVALPLFGGALGSLAAVRALAAGRSRKTVVLAGAGLQVATLASLVVLDLPHGLGPAGLLGIALLHQVGGQGAGTAWSSWYGDLVHASVRGTWFGRRSRFAYVATCGALVVSGLMLQRLEPGAAGTVAAGAGGVGFRWIFGIASAARLASVVLLALSPEPPFRGLLPPARARRFLATTRGRSAWRLLALGASLQLLVYVGSPFFGPFMLDGLRFTYVEYMVASVMVVAVKVLVLPAWGRAVDAHGARSVLCLAAVLVACVPLPWLWASGLAWVLVAQAFSGFSWGAYEVSFFSLVLESTWRPTRPWVFAAQNLAVGSAQLLGALVGAALLVHLHGGYRVVFATSLAARLGLALAFPRLLPVISRAPPLHRRTLLLRVIGLRPHGGITHRPVEEPAPPAPSAR